MKKRLFLSAIIAICSFVSNPLFAVCPTQPDCASMGFTMSTTDCSGATTIRCPFDPSNNNAVFCHKISGGSTCDTGIQDLITMMGGTLQSLTYMFSSPGACSFSNKCYMNSTYTLDNSSSCDSSQYVCTGGGGIGDNNAYFSFASAGCDVSSSASIRTNSGDYKIGSGVYSEVPVNFYGAAMRGSAIFKGDGNVFYYMHFYDDFSQLGQALSGSYDGGAIVLAGNTTITTLKLETTKNVPLLVGDDSGKSVLLELYGIMASSTKGQLCIGLRPGGSVLVAGGTTTYNDVVSTKKEITAPGSGYYSSNPVVIATAGVCLGAAEGTTSGGSSSGGSGSSGSSGSCDTSYYKYTNCDSSTTVCSNTCTMNGTTYYSPSGCRYASGSNHREYNGNPYCCDPSKYKYSSLPNGMTWTTFIEKCSDMYAPTLYYIPDGTQCENTAYTFNASQGKCCHISSGACL